MAPPKSKVWAYFTKTNETAATCKRCFKTVKYCGNTSNLFKHAHTHGTVVNKKQQKNADKDRNESSKSTTVSANSADIMGVDESQSSTSRTSPKDSDHDEAGSSICIEDNNRTHLRNTLQEAFARVSSNKEGGAKYNRIVQALIFFICKDMRPFNVVQGEGFLRLMKEVEPTFKVPSAKYLKKRTVEKFDAYTASCKLRLSKVDNICLTLDIWTETMNESSFLGVTAHFLENNEMCMYYFATRVLSERHTAEYISENLLDILEKWDIPLSKIRAAVTDNASSMFAAVRTALGKKNICHVLRIQ